MSLSVRFLAVAAPVVLVAMILLGNWASERIERSATRSAAEAGAIFLQAFLEPFIQDLPSASTLSADTEQRLDRILPTGDLPERFIMLKIWRLDATLIYSSNKNIIPHEPVEDEIRMAAGGELARHFEQLDEEVKDIPPQANIALLEVYAPLYRTGTNEIIAVGEFYQSAAGLIGEQQQTRLLTWAMVAAAAVSIVFVLYLIVAQGSRTIERQRQTLERQFHAARHLASQNNVLRKTAERARVDASETNENFLSRIGADIHDGPIQTLSLLMLSLQYGRDGERAEASEPSSHDPPSTILLAKLLYSELRNISTGLILPEVQSATLSQVFEIACARYEATTAGEVRLTLKRLPDEAPLAVKICCYRIVQEGLNNGLRHAGGKGQQVVAGASKGRVRIMIIDQGAGFDLDKGRDHGGLGLVGIRNRVKALKGKISIQSQLGRGTRIFVSMPIDPEAQ